MSLGLCIPELIEQGKLPKGRAAEIRAVYDGLVEQYSQSMGKAAAEAKATVQTLKKLETDHLDVKRRSMLQGKSQADWLADMQDKAGDGPLDWKQAEEQLVRIDKKIDTVRGVFFASMDAMLAKHRRNVFGVVRAKSDLVDALRHMRGEKVDSLNARELGDSMNAVLEMVRQRANAAGASIGKIANYGLPQRHDARAIRAVSYNEWRNFGPVERMDVLDLDTGEMAQGAKREDLLKAIHETLRTDGANKDKPGAMGNGSMATRRDDARFLHFTSTDDWLEYQAKFGGGESIFDIFTGHVGAMARDIALMEELGPNPAASIKYRKDWIDKSAGMVGSQKDIDKVNGRTAKMQSLYDELTGANKLPDNRSMALTFSAIRATQVASKLGSAVLSSVTDFATLMFNAGFNKVPVIETLGRYGKLWNPLDDGDRRLAVRLGLVTDDWINLSSSAARYTGEELTGEVSRRVAEFVIRGQGLARHTRNAQWAFGMEFLSMLTQMKDVGIDALDPVLARQFQRHNISAADWDAYRATAARDERGSDWIMPGDAGKSGEKILQMVLTETDFAVIAPDIRTRAMINGVMRPGNFFGELGRSALLFKSFPLAMINLHGRRMLEQQGLQGKLGYAVTLMPLMMAAGALSVQLKLIDSGKDPQPMDDRKFWTRALVQSGGLGLFGDLLYNSENSYGGGVLATLAGPILGSTVPNMWDATAGNAGKALDGDDKTETSFAKDISKVAESEIPGRNLWYLKLAWQRLVADNIREMTDPRAAEAFRKAEKRATNEGTEFWWAPGEGAPDRAPQLEPVLSNEGGFEP
jgi:hypothetical protein